LKGHEISSAEYKEKYGKTSLASDEYREKRSQMAAGKNNTNYGKKHTLESRKKMSTKQKGKTPWNKGKKFHNTDMQKQAAINREQRYASGEMQRTLHDYSDSMRKKVSDSVIAYANANPEKMSDRANKAIATKIARGDDIAFFRGRTHTDATKEKISTSSKLSGLKKTADSVAKAYNNAEIANCTIRDLNNRVVDLTCNSCHAMFSRTRQYLTASGKFKKNMCEVCYPRNYKTSKVEQEIADYVSGLGLTIIQNTRRVLNSKKEIDIYVPEKNLAIEVNGTYWHSQILLESNGYSKLRDSEKYKEAVEQSITMISIYDAEWIEKGDIVRSRLAGFAGKSKTIGGRKCQLREISSKEANTFLNQNHLQGSGRSNARYGLYYNNALVSVMTFSKENISRKIKGWEINRYCNKLNTTVQGGASKLFKRFCNDHSPEEVISYSDNRWGNGSVYSRLGFAPLSQTPPNYWYFQANDTKMYHRYTLRKSATDDQELTEWQNRQQQGWNRIWDCGNTKWSVRVQNTLGQSN